MIQEHKPTGHDQVVQRVLITAGIAASMVILIGVTVAPLWAQSYPNKPIRFVMPFPPGGATDGLGRIIGSKLSERLGQPVVIENRPGAGSNIGIEVAAKSRPDGYTVLLSAPAIAISPNLYKKLNYDPIKDLAPISRVAQISNLVCVRASLPVNTLRELVEFAKTNPGKLNFGSGGIGTSNHLTGELFRSITKTNIVHVPYKGVSLAATAMMSNEVDMVITNIPTSLSQIQSGRMKALAVAGSERLLSLPNVPTAKEAGVDNFETTTWYGLLAPAGTPRDIIDRLNAEWIKIEAMPDTKEKLLKVGFEPMTSSPEQFAEFIKIETARYRKVIKDANIPRID